MDADLYWEWLKVPRERRPPTYFDLLGIGPNEENAAVIEKAAHDQVLRVKDRLDGPRAAEGAKLLQEIAQAKVTLLDPAQRAAYKASLSKPGGPTWWKNEIRPATAKPIPVV